MNHVSKLNIKVHIFKNCPNAKSAISITKDVLDHFCPGTPIEIVKVENEQEAEQKHFLGSPSIVVNGQDIECRHNKGISFGCRIYQNGQGIPDRWLVEAAILRELKLNTILFLCVQNSARSQMAEGIARHIFKERIHVQSAGSNPSQVKAEAIEVLSEMGIDISHHQAKSIESVSLKKFDAVITLCAKEVCPTYLGKVFKLHWELEDPPAASYESRIHAFREIRDELFIRIRALEP